MSLRSAAGVAALLIAQGACFPQPAAAQPARPWMDASLSPDARADLVIKELTLDEKIQLVHGIGWGPLKAGQPVPRTITAVPVKS
jgi:beta-glucosidase